jgi:hypothetical protein
MFKALVCVVLSVFVSLWRVFVVGGVHSEYDYDWLVGAIVILLLAYAFGNMICVWSRKHKAVGPDFTARRATAELWVKSQGKTKVVNIATGGIKQG